MDYEVIHKCKMKNGGTLTFHTPSKPMTEDDIKEFDRFLASVIMYDKQISEAKRNTKETPS